MSGPLGRRAVRSPIATGPCRVSPRRWRTSGLAMCGPPAPGSPVHVPDRTALEGKGYGRLSRGCSGPSAPLPRLSEWGFRDGRDGQSGLRKRRSDPFNAQGIAEPLKCMPHPRREFFSESNCNMQRKSLAPYETLYLQGSSNDLYCGKSSRELLSILHLQYRNQGEVEAV